eukprot:3481459-Lingulodinium_polyedra.AAC.1
MARVSFVSLQRSTAVRIAIHGSGAFLGFVVKQSVGRSHGFVVADAALLRRRVSRDSGRAAREQ